MTGLVPHPRTSMQEGLGLLQLILGKYIIVYHFLSYIQYIRDRILLTVRIRELSGEGRSSNEVG